MKRPLALAPVLAVIIALSSCKGSSSSPSSPNPSPTAVAGIKSFVMGNASWSCVGTDTSGNVYVAAASSCSPCGTFELVKADSSGDCVWAKSYTGYSGISVNGVFAGSYGIIIAGNALPGSAYFTLFKADSSGVKQSFTQYDCGWESAGGFLAEGDGSVDVAGFTQSDGLTACNFINYGDALLTKVGSTGSEVFRKYYTADPSNNSNSFNCVIKTSDGGFAAVGKTYNYNYTGSGDSTDIYFVKTDSSGNASWARQIAVGSNLYDEGMSVVQNSDNTFMIMAKAGGADISGAMLYFISTDSSGNNAVSHQFTTDLCYQGYKMIPGNDGGYITAGRGNSCAGMLLKVNSSGVKVWEYDNTSGVFTDVSAVSDGYIVTGTGSIDINGSYENRAFIMKINNSGARVW